MRLRRIEAVRYGGLLDATLGDLGDDLTVVLGPNEAGKSTFTALVRHVLYGYPRGNEREPGYVSDAGGRLGRLVFEAGDGAWVVERAEGSHGGAVEVRALRGPDRPALLAEVTHGVSRLAYQVVFGFGLAEMAQIEELRGSEDDIIARLYAASAGLRVSPHEVRASLEREAGELFRPRARTRVIPALITELRGVRSRIAELRRQADTFGVEQRRVRELEAELAHARETRDGARARATELALASERAEERVREIEECDFALIGLRRELKELTEGVAAIATHPAALAAALELELVIGEEALFAEGRQELREEEEALVRAEARAADAVGRTGLGAEEIAALDTSAALTAALDQARDDIARLSLQVESRVEEEARTREAAERAREAAAAALDALGVAREGARESVASRLDAIEAVESARSSAHGIGRGGSDLPALIMAVAGVAAGVAGSVLREWLTVAIGVALALAGGWFLLRARSGGHRAYPDEARSLELLGLPASTGGLELARTRRTLEGIRSALDAAEAAEHRAREAADGVALAEAALETRGQLFADELAAHGFPRDLTPPAAARLAEDVREAQRALAALEEARFAVGRRCTRLDEYAARLARVADGIVELPAQLDHDAVPALVSRLKERLDAGRESARQRDALERDAATVGSKIEDADSRRVRAAEELTALLEAFDLVDGGTVHDLHAARAAAESHAEAASGRFEEIAQTKDELVGKLATEARENRGAELSLEESSLRERVRAESERYLVLAAAARLLGEAQARYERERQPDVVRYAEAAYRRITGGRYVGLSVPLGDGRIEVFDGAARAKTSEALSRGSAEQLYLALRLGLIAHLGEAGVGLPVLMDDVFVNFDPERRRGAAEVIAELARERQLVLFTCHPETAALFAEVAPDHARIELARCER